MTIRKSAIAILGFSVGLWALVMAGVARADYVYQGNDFSYSNDGNRRTVICDDESDGHGVHADYYSFAGNSYRVDDLDGAGGQCWESTAHQSGIQKHRTVEEINNWPDYKSAWSTH